MKLSVFPLLLAPSAMNNIVNCKTRELSTQKRKGVPENLALKRTLENPSEPPNINNNNDNWRENKPKKKVR